MNRQRMAGQKVGQEVGTKGVNMGLKCARCGRTDFLSCRPSNQRGMETVLCLDCCDDYDKKYKAFMNKFLKSKPISSKINDMLGKELP